MIRILTFFIGLILVVGSYQTVQAQIESPQYRILEPTIGIDDVDKRIQTTMTAAELTTFYKQEYILRDNGLTSLKATLSHSTLTFENSSGQAQNLGTVLTVTSENLHRYQTLIQAQNSLKTVWGDEIQATQCDSSCTINFARPWKKVGSFGFGYTLKGEDIPTDFKDISYYRRFPDATRQEEPRIIMYGTFTKNTKQSTMILRVNVPKDQPDGTYQTIVNLIVSPLF